MTNLDETELALLEELAGKASLPPWANTDTAKELLNVEPDDWWKNQTKRVRLLHLTLVHTHLARFRASSKIMF